MENNLDTNIITTEAVEAVADAMPKGGNTLKTVAKVGAVGIAGAAIWELAIKPVGRLAKKAITNWAAGRKTRRKGEDDAKPQEAEPVQAPEKK